MAIAIKRAYDAPAADDGMRVPVDRLWLRGVKKEAAAIDEWPKDATPTTELRSTPSKRKEMARSIAEARAAETKQRRLEEALEQLRAD